MKVAITADLHLSTKQDHPERYNALDNILTQIQETRIPTLIIAGDLFDKDFHNYSEFEQICQNYPMIQIHIIPGNHDININGKSVIGKNIHIYDVPSLVEAEDNLFVLIPYAENATMAEKIEVLSDEIIDKSWILIGHGDYCSGAKEINPLEPGTYMPLSRQNLSEFKPRIVFLGHIHKPITLNNLHYVGSPCGLDIGETGKRTFIVYDTSEGHYQRVFVSTDLLYLEESFLNLPLDNEVSLLNQEIASRIRSWNIDPTEYHKIRIRVNVKGYSMNRSAILSALNEGFSGFKYYKDEGPQLAELSTSTDPQMNAIAERTIKLIEQMEWDYTSDEPDVDSIKMEALRAIYES